MKVSVIIPALNEEKRIGQALDALKQQDYRDFEVFVVDNGSTDNTVDIAQKYPVTVIHEPRKGTMWACHSGFTRSNGEIIVRMDADCIPDPRWLSKGVDYFANEWVGLVSGPYDYYDAGWFFRNASLLMQMTVYPVVNYVLQLVGLGALSIGGNTFIRRTILEKMHGFNTDLTFYGDDTDTAKRASKYGKVFFSSGLIVRTSAPTALRHGGNKKVFKYWIHFFKVIFSH